MQIPGIYIIKLTAENKAGKAERDLKLVVGNAFALTPPMGCNTWEALDLLLMRKGCVPQLRPCMKS